MRHEYREFARFCEELAETTISQAERDRWLQAARKWRSLDAKASSREQTIDSED